MCPPSSWRCSSARHDAARMAPEHLSDAPPPASTLDPIAQAELSSGADEELASSRPASSLSEGPRLHGALGTAAPSSRGACAAGSSAEAHPEAAEGSTDTLGAAGLTSQSQSELHGAVLTQSMSDEDLPAGALSPAQYPEHCPAGAASTKWQAALASLITLSSAACCKSEKGRLPCAAGSRPTSAGSRHRRGAGR